MDSIVCISRQVASGGHEIGIQLAERLHVPFYDNEIIAECVKETGLAEALIQNHDERSRESLLYSIVMGCYPRKLIGASYPEAPGDQVFQIQANVIRELAEKGPCVIVGRCAGDILWEYPQSCRVFVHAGMDFRKARAVERYGYDPKKAEYLLHKKDQERAAYHTHYTSRTWNALENFDLTIDSSRCGIDGAVNTILAYLENLLK